MIETHYFSNARHPTANAAVGEFVSRQIWGQPGRVKDYCSMAVFDGNLIVAGTLYHNYYPDEGVIELTSASTSKRWLSRRVIRTMFRLPFDVLGCQIVVLRVSSNNTGMLKIARLFGFSEHVIPRLRGREEHEHVFTLTDDQWRGHKLNPELNSSQSEIETAKKA